MGTIMGLVPALAPIAGGALHAVFGWRANFWAQTLFGLSLTAIVLLRLPETIRARSPGPISFLSILRGFRTLLAHPGYRVYVAMSALAYCGLFSFISGSSFVLQGIYGLSEMAFALTFALVVIGYISGTTVAQRLVGSLGLDGTIRIGVVALAAGGVSMLALVLLKVPSALAVALPMALYTFGVGLTMPQAMASAMAPFPDAGGRRLLPPRPLPDDARRPRRHRPRPDARRLGAALARLRRRRRAFGLRDLFGERRPAGGLIAQSPNRRSNRLRSPRAGADGGGIQLRSALAVE